MRCNEPSNTDTCLARRGYPGSRDVDGTAYRFDFRNSAFSIQPNFQYIIRPGETGRLNNAPVFGTQLCIIESCLATALRELEKDSPGGLIQARAARWHSEMLYPL